MGNSVTSVAASVAVFGLATLAAVTFGGDSARFASRPFDALVSRPALHAISSADAFGRSGGVTMRLTLPGDGVEFPLGVTDPAQVSYQWVRLTDSVPDGTAKSLVGAYLRAPSTPGFYALTLLREGQEPEVLKEPVLAVMVPFEAKRGSILNGYRIGTYIGERLGVGFERPEGFLQVGPQDLDRAVSKHFRIADFISRDTQKDVWPKYVAISPRLLDKLELVVTEVQRLRGGRRGAELALGVHSGFRTPIHNRGVSSAARDSRHQYGDAADVVMDANGDGRITASDGAMVARAVEAVELANPDLVGGLGLYTSARYRTPYVHIDARGQKTRWRG
jgi:uncharacterized protein YcbK (DUF882 family)